MRDTAASALLLALLAPIVGGRGGARSLRAPHPAVGIAEGGREVEGALPLALPPASEVPASHFLAITNHAFCSMHWCFHRCCRNCTAPPAAAAGRPHLLYLHTEKTGGTSIECATAHTLVPLGAFSNMGHAHVGSVAHCRQRCTFGGVRPRVVVSVRDPYAFYRSLFVYAWACRNAAVCIPPEGPATSDTFANFIRWCNLSHYVNATVLPERMLRASQAAYVRRACGKPCVHDEVLRVETLDSDWLRLLHKYRLPLVGLPRVNPTAKALAAPRWPERGPPPRTIFTREVLAIINEVEADIFDQFKYTRRVEPFELT